MSEENVERARRGYGLVDVAYRTGDWSTVERHLDETFDADVLMEGGDAEMVFTEGEWHGRAGILSFLKGQTEALDDMWIGPDEFIEVSDDVLVVSLSVGGPDGRRAPEKRRALLSGAPVLPHPCGGAERILLGTAAVHP